MVNALVADVARFCRMLRLAAPAAVQVARSLRPADSCARYRQRIVLHCSREKSTVARVRVHSKLRVGEQLSKLCVQLTGSARLCCRAVVGPAVRVGSH